MQLDHIVLLVKNLEQAVADYTAKGFTVSPGGEHAGGVSRNALIHFQDATFLELLEVKTSGRSTFLQRMYKRGLLAEHRQTARYGMAHRFYGRVFKLLADNPEAEGVTDFCLLAADDTHAAVDAQLPLTPPYEASRLRPDGQTVRWQMYTPIDAEALPFFRTDYRPQIVRPPEALQHANGALGTHKVCLFVDDYASVIQSYKRLLPELIPQVNNDATLFELGKGSIEIIDKKSTTRTQEVAQAVARGIGRLSVVLRTQEVFLTV